jgi:geranylgeranyl diphosphate synthase type I
VSLPPTLARFVSRYAMAVDAFMGDHVRGMPEALYRASLHLIKAGGKRLRPAVVLLFARALGGSEAEHQAVPLAAAVELFHNFTLIHDDIMDRDETRRGVPTTHVLYGVDMAILAGDLLHAEAFRAIYRGLDYGLDPETVSRALGLLAWAAKRVSEGQALDMSFEGRWDVSVSDYLDMIYLKTGALIEASAGMGALAASNDESYVEAARQYGRLVGVAFQIRDDYLGVYGDPARTGKPVYSDLRRGKKTILVIYAVNSLPKEKAERLKSIVGNPSASEADLAEAADLIKESGAVDYALRLAGEMASNAGALLDDLPAEDSTAVEALRELARFVVEREK